MGDMPNLGSDFSVSSWMPFQFQNWRIRVLVDTNGEPLFVGKDVCDCLAYARSSDAIQQHCKGAALYRPLQTGGGVQNMRVLTEPDMLRLIVNSELPTAEAFERWVFEEVLPSIRRTGSYSMVDPLASLPPEQRAIVNLMLDTAAIKQLQAEQGAAIARIEQRVEENAQAQLMLVRPANAESIVHIRERINKLYGLPAWVVDTVLRQSLYAPKPAGMVKNTREEARGASYAVYWVKDISALFAKFVGECIQVTRTQATHPLIDRRFQLTVLEAGNGQ